MPVRFLQMQSRGARAAADRRAARSSVRSVHRGRALVCAHAPAGCSAALSAAAAPSVVFPSADPTTRSGPGALLWTAPRGAPRALRIPQRRRRRVRPGRRSARRLRPMTSLAGAAHLPPMPEDWRSRGCRSVWPRDRSSRPAPHRARRRPEGTRRQCRRGWSGHSGKQAAPSGVRASIPARSRRAERRARSARPSRWAGRRRRWRRPAATSATSQSPRRCERMRGGRSRCACSATTASRPRAARLVPVGAGPVEAVAATMDYRAEVLLVWASGGTVYARELSPAGALGPTRRLGSLAAGSPDPELRALLSDDGHAIVAWRGQSVAPGGAPTTTIELSISGGGLAFGAPQVLERFRDLGGFVPPAGSLRLLRLSSEAVMIAWTGVDAGRYVVRASPVSLRRGAWAPVVISDFGSGGGQTSASGAPASDARRDANRTGRASSISGDAVLADLAAGPDAEAFAVWRTAPNSPGGTPGRAGADSGRFAPRAATTPGGEKSPSPPPNSSPRPVPTDRRRSRSTPRAAERWPRGSRSRAGAPRGASSTRCVPPGRRPAHRPPSPRRTHRAASHGPSRYSAGCRRLRARRSRACGRASVAASLPVRGTCATTTGLIPRMVISIDAQGGGVVTKVSSSSDRGDGSSLAAVGSGGGEGDGRCSP